MGSIQVTSGHMPPEERQTYDTPTQLPPGAKLPALRRMPRYKPVSDEYAGLVFDPAYVSAQLDAHRSMYGYPACMRYPPSGPMVLLYRPNKTYWSFYAVPIDPETGTLGKLGQTVWVDKTVLSLCRNLAAHCKAHGFKLAV